MVRLLSNATAGLSSRLAGLRRRVRNLGLIVLPARKGSQQVCGSPLTFRVAVWDLERYRMGTAGFLQPGSVLWMCELGCPAADLRPGGNTHAVP